jgi:hypothetical protein
MELVAAYLKRAENARVTAKASPTRALSEQYLTIAASWDQLAKERVRLLNMDVLKPETAPGT